MPYCPNCHTAYRDGFTTCSDCGATLVPDDPTESSHRPERVKSRLQPPVIRKQYPGDRFLANISDAVELAYIRSSLGEQGIPCRVIAEDVSDYLYIISGLSYMGVNVYVPEDSFPSAFETWASYKAESLPDEKLSHVSKAVQSRQYRFGVWILRAYLFYNLILLLSTGTLSLGI
jgi:hypothetical protein